MTLAFLVDSVEFTKAVIAGETSLGGSESACLGLARALKARGHDVHIFTTQLAQDAAGVDFAGVQWHDYHDFAPMNQFIEFDAVIALRMFAQFGGVPIYSRLRILWTQDLLVPGAMQLGVMAVAWGIDQIAYVSDYHRRQWEQLQPELAPIGWVTGNGFDPAHLPLERPVKDPTRIIHISRPERGLGPILQMWPALKAQCPSATLRICRYSSMYDQGPGSWTDVCASWDREVAAVNAEVGGITYLGELNKRQLYQEISEAAVMWYPGVSTFAETNCISALEAEACGTPFVGSYRGALPETSPTGILIKGDHTDPTYQAESISAVLGLLDGCATSSFDYRKRQKDGRIHADLHTYAVLAEQWDTQINAWFTERYESHKPAVLRQLLHEDDHTAAKLVALDILNGQIEPSPDYKQPDGKYIAEARAARDFCDYVIAGKDQSADDYGERAIADPLKEVEFSDRFKQVVPIFGKCEHVLDVACGNGSFAIGLALANPNIHVYGLDYSPANIARAQDGAQRAGVADRCTFEQCTVYDFDAQALHADWFAFMADHPEQFDGLFCGEFVEHVGNYHALIDGLEAALVDGAQVVYTCPHGAFAELYPIGPHGIPLRRGHVHRFHHDDLRAVFGSKLLFWADYLPGGTTERGYPLGNWIVRYTKAPDRPVGSRPLLERIRKTRPLQKISVGLIAKDVENDLGRCLASIHKIADEIVVGDTGSSDDTKKIAASYGATILDLPAVIDTREGFAGARNAVLKACSGEWFLWIDADEQLMNAPWLRRYLDGLIFNGFVLRQTHLYLDAAPTFDIPVRLFRNTGKVQFYGCVHEQPQDGDPNADIFPTLEVQDVTIAHTGYLTQQGREDKRVHRNLPLLKRDAEVFRDRLLGKVLLLREAVIQSDLSSAKAGRVTPYAQEGYTYAVRIFVDHFDDPGHKYHKLARPWYEAALRHLGLGWEQEIAIAGRQGGLEGRHAAPERCWVRDAAEFQRVMAHKVEDMAKRMLPTTFITDPDALKKPQQEEREKAIA